MPSVRPTASGTVFDLLVEAAARPSVGMADTLVLGAGVAVKVAVEVIESSAAAFSSGRTLHDHQKKVTKETKRQDVTLIISLQD